MLKLRRTHGFSLRLSASAALRRSAGSPRAASTQPTFLNPHLEAAKADQPPALPSPPRAAIGQPETADRSRPWSRRTEAPQAPAHGGTGAGHDRGRLVRAGSARQREPLVLAGRQRSRPADKNRSSHGLHRCGLGRPSRSGPGSNPSVRARRVGRLQVRRRVTRSVHGAFLLRWADNLLPVTLLPPVGAPFPAAASARCRRKVSSSRSTNPHRDGRRQASGKAVPHADGDP
jgi:hypothetical protein